MKYLSVAVFLFLIGFAPNVQAEEAKHYSDEYQTCMDASRGATSPMVACMNEERERQDARLNAVYKSLMQALPEERKARLRTAQRAWIAYRDANVEFIWNDPDGGSIVRILAADWILSSTFERAKELGLYLDPEGSAQ